MNRKKGIAIGFLLLLVLLVGGGVYYYFTKQDVDTTLTILEKKWIEDNKNQVIDLGIVNEVPVFSEDGKGVLFEFVSAIEGATHLSFNKLPYYAGAKLPSEYSFTIVKKPEDGAIEFYKDHYGIVTKDTTKYQRIEDIGGMTLGVLNSDLEEANYSLKANKNVAFKGYDSYTAMFTDLNQEDSSIQGVIVPLLLSMEQIVTNQNTIAYHIPEMSQTLVLQLGSNKKLNEIITKYTKKWKEQNLDTSFRDYFSAHYFDFSETYEQARTKFRSKTYTYGFVEQAPYDALINQRLVGTNNELMKRFAALANIEIKFVPYKSEEALLKEFNENKIDFFFDRTNTTEYAMDTKPISSGEQEIAAVISKTDSTKTIHSFSSLKGESVGVVAGTALEKVAKDYGIEVTSYNNLRSLFNHKKETFFLLDLDTYLTYSHNALSKYKLDWLTPFDGNYAFVARDIEENKVFNEYFNFYLSFIDADSYRKNVTYSMFNETVESNLKYYLWGTGFVLVLIVTIAYLTHLGKQHKKKKKTGLSKESKLKYIDLLTSLKNRNYLNESMEKWDESGIYPQSIIIVDLNNVAYINDNYGHEEGDNVIREAANILIRNQIENSEMMRTNGNEFLIYLIAYDEKQVVSYIRKLNKEFKELSHGFGAAIGYSMILDPIKTVDDAINEATLDMRSNKEEANN